MLIILLIENHYFKIIYITTTNTTDGEITKKKVKTLKRRNMEVNQ